MAKIFGLPGSDEESNRKFAATLMKYKGWRSVAYQGKGVFLVDYHAEGTLAQDVVFPDDSGQRPDHAVHRHAPPRRRLGAGQRAGLYRRVGAVRGAGQDDGPARQERRARSRRPQGRFTIVTDGEILTNNSEDGAAPHAKGRAAQVGRVGMPPRPRVPEALVKL